MRKAQLAIGLILVACFDALSPNSLTLSLFYALLSLQAGTEFGVKPAVSVSFLAVSLHILVNGLPSPWHVSLAQDLSELCLLIIVGLEAAMVQARAQDAKKLHQRLSDHLQAARQVQKAMLSLPNPAEIRAEMSLRYDIAVELGGDLFFLLQDDNGLLFCVADVSGKGPAAALVAALMRGLLAELAGQADGPAQLLHSVHLRLQELLPESMFVTCFCGYLDYSTGSLIYSGAGHDPPLLLHQGNLSELPSQCLPLGIDPTMALEQTTLRLAPSDLLLVYTDGLTDGRLADGSRLGDAAVRRQLAEHQGSCADLTERLFQLLPEQLEDDAMILALRCPPAGKA